MDEFDFRWEGQLYYSVRKHPKQLRMARVVASMGDSMGYVDDGIIEVLHETDLSHFQQRLEKELHLLRVEHFDHAKDKDLQGIGIPPPAIRRLRAALAEKKKRMSKKPLFFGSRKREADAFSAENNENNQPVEVADSAIPFEQIKLMERLGEGTFAVVKRAIWTRNNGQKLDVAVKILRDATPLVVEELQLEANNLRRLQHHNLIRLYGVVENPAIMVFELCPGGSLLERLREREKPVLLVSSLLEYCQQMATGMTYLESKHCVHRDLAARNILLSANEKIVKICDFGLMRTLEDNERLYVMNPQKRVPFAWCPPEALRQRQFSHASDVWSMGVAMWEIFTYGDEPWCTLRAIDVLQKVEAGERLEKPRRCSSHIYELMSMCWRANPEERPRFNLLRNHLKEAALPVADGREAVVPSSLSGDNSLQLALNDRVLVIDNVGTTWFGQNIRTRQFGSFRRSVVFVDSERSREHSERAAASAKSSRISLPIKGSFIHAGHGDISGGGWGKVDSIDEIYLKNPVLGAPLAATNGDVSFISSVSSITMKKPPVAEKPASLSIATRADPFEEAQLDDFSPSFIRLPRDENGPFTDAWSSAPNWECSSFPSTSSALPSAPPPPPYDEPPIYGEPPSSVQARPSLPKASSSSSLGLFQIPPSAAATRKPALGLNSLPRPQSTSRPPGASSRSANNTPPPVKAAAYSAIPSSGGDAKDAMGEVAARLPASVPSSALFNLTRPASVASPSITTSSVTWNGPQLRPSAPSFLHSGGEVIWRRGEDSRETPLLNHSQMSTLHGPFSTSNPGLDPFQVDEAIRSLASRGRNSDFFPSARNGTATARIFAAPPLSSSTTPALLLPTQPLTPSPLSTTVSLPSTANRSQSLLAASYSNPRPANGIAERVQPSMQQLTQQSRILPGVAAAPQVVLSRPLAPSAPPQPLLQSSRELRPPSSALQMLLPQKQPTGTRDPLPSSPSNTQIAETSTSALSDSARKSTIEESVKLWLPPPSALLTGNSASPSNGKPRSSECAVGFVDDRASRNGGGAAAAQPLNTGRSGEKILGQPALPTSVLQPTLLPTAAALAAAAASSSAFSAPRQPIPSFATTQVPLFALSRKENIFSRRHPHQLAAPQQVPLFSPQQVPLFSPQQVPLLSPPNPSYLYPSLPSFPQDLPTDEVLRMLDPLTSSSPRIPTYTPSSTSASSLLSQAVNTSRTSQMEQLYKDAHFSDRARCDWMVARSGGNVVLALRELKKEYLVDLGVAASTIHAEAALLAHNWDLNAAVDAIYNGAF